MNKHQPLIDFLENEARSCQMILRGIAAGDKWTRNHNGREEDVTQQTKADAERKLRDAQTHIARLRSDR
jgi:hypothetical protein